MLVSLEDIDRWLTEDIGAGDLTALIVPAETHATAKVVTREDTVVCGQPWVEAVFARIDPQTRITWSVDEGSWVAAGTQLCELSGTARSLLTGERTALNLLQTLSGTATLARRYANAVSGSAVTVLDTRKTLPGLRKAQKYAVRCGGCQNHRMGLYDGILIKENHIMAAGSIHAAVQQAHALGADVPVEVEVENLAELTQAMEAGADRVLLDNFSLELMRQAVAINAGRLKLEVSGNVSLDNIADIAATGVDYISVGALTKNVQAIDLSMRITLVQ
ncbi:carboxylating nicotinate-nucleotide diphosphorylase [Methyloterricola oryzae]|uniref:carboxylating nicotinate-nucleotide diphosphorylase n=1 Tax=Methyloterricola oryzae TaxID=1495050 RepID=UPI0005EBA864|nr:carboxylating nicotinate-nucleotide diphosphorylase [Methyloterricola oryzae]